MQQGLLALILLPDSSCAMRTDCPPRWRLNRGGENGWPDDPVQSACLAPAHRHHGQPGDETGRQYSNWGRSAKQGGDRSGLPLSACAGKLPHRQSTPSFTIRQQHGQHHERPRDLYQGHPSPGRTGDTRPPAERTTQRAGRERHPDPPPADPLLIRQRRGHLPPAGAGRRALPTSLPGVLDQLPGGRQPHPHHPCAQAVPQPLPGSLLAQDAADHASRLTCSASDRRAVNTAWSWRQTPPGTARSGTCRRRPRWPTAAAAGRRSGRCRHSPGSRK